MSRRLTIDIITASLIVLFTYAGLSKIVDHTVFKEQLRQSSWTLPPFTVTLTSWVLPVLELLTTSLLVRQGTKIRGLWLSLVLLLTFAGYIIIILSPGGHLPARCCGAPSLVSWHWNLVFTIGFAALAIAGILLETQESLSANAEESYKYLK